ncbi:MAG: single-stranded DNA-binding protein [Candidatus Moranbacteria bacterium]|nr:single-stranded DNA-binding protein [Candidatus Moranbacteria bacterium]
MNVNKAIIVGRLTRDPEARTTPNGKSVTSIAIATSNIWKDAEGNKQEKTEYHDVVMWGRLAEIAAQYLVKGQEVYVEGRLETRNWEGKDGVTRYKTEIILSGMDGKMQMGNKPQGSQQASGGNKNPNSQAKTAPKKDSKSQQDEEEIRIEDIPF